jgi:(2S)-methylsuccinyl-CoA dehydrogenase
MGGNLVGLETPVLEGLLDTCASALPAAESVLRAARQAVADKVTADGKINARRLDAEQFAAHGYAWLATYVEGARQMLEWARHLDADGQLGELEQLMVQSAFGEYLNQIEGGIAISQVEIVRPGDLGLTDDNLTPLRDGAAAKLRA